MPNELNPTYANSLVDNLATGAAVPSGARWLALFTSEWVESTDYAGRVDISGDFGASSGGAITNDTIVTFSFTSGDVISHWAICDDDTADPATSYLERGPLQSTETVGPGGTLDIAISALNLSVTPGP